MKVPKTSVAIASASLVLLFLALAFALACEVPQPTGDPSSGTISAKVEVNRSEPHDLSRDESAGGHTLRKHVGRTDDQLRERLRHEREISAASTWTDRETAERAIGIALSQNEEKIQRWLARDSHPNLVLDYNGPQPIGRSLPRRADQPEPCSHATIVLRWSGPGSYYVLTSYPECRS